VRSIVVTIAISSFLIITCSAQHSAVGVWKTVDDNQKDTTSLIEIYDVDGKLHGKIIEILGEQTIFYCKKCKGDKKDKPVLGLEVIWDMRQDKENEWKGGRIMDPENGKEYKCKMKLAEDNVLEVRGYVGFSLLGRTQKWFRKK